MAEAENVFLIPSCLFLSLPVLRLHLNWSQIIIRQMFLGFCFSRKFLLYSVCWVCIGVNSLIHCKLLDTVNVSVTVSWLVNKLLSYSCDACSISRICRICIHKKFWREAKMKTFPWSSWEEGNLSSRTLVDVVLICMFVLTAIATKTRNWPQSIAIKYR